MRRRRKQEEAAYKRGCIEPGTMSRYSRCHSNSDDREKKVRNSDPSGLCLCRQIQCMALLYVRFIHHTRDTHGVDKMCRTVACIYFDVYFDVYFVFLMSMSRHLALSKSRRDCFPLTLLFPPRCHVSQPSLSTSLSSAWRNCSQAPDYRRFSTRMPSFEPAFVGPCARTCSCRTTR